MTIEFGLVSAIDAESFGQPGQRTFRLRVIGQAQDTASLWMEKQQFQALSLALAQVLAQLDYNREPPPQDMSVFPDVPDHDFRVGRMAISFDPSDQTVVLHLADILSEDEEEVTLRFKITQDQSAGLRANLDEIIESGRPVCRLCGQPIDAGGHACIRSNGHLKLPIPEEGTGQEEGP